jgi:hypothetical protein
MLACVGIPQASSNLIVLVNYTVCRWLHELKDSCVVEVGGDIHIGTPCWRPKKCAVIDNYSVCLAAQ